jgi:methyl-accepting chemotaxis protein
VIMPKTVWRRRRDLYSFPPIWNFEQAQAVVKLPQFSIATKLYAIFALLGTVTGALAMVAVLNARQHAALTEEFESAFAGAMNVERVNALIYAVVMESRGIYMSSEIPTVKVYGDGLLVFNDRIGKVVKEWRRAVRGDDAELFEAFSKRIQQFQDFRRELVRRAIEINPAAGREWGDNDANRTVRKALNEDLEALGKLYAQRSERIYSRIDQGIDRTAWLVSLIAGIAVLLALLGMVIMWRAVVRPLARITRITELVAAGNAQHEVPYGDRGDEIGALARSIAVFQDTMRRNDELSRKVIDDAQARVRRQEGIAVEISRFGAEVEATLSELGRISSQMLAASGQLSEAADDASTRTTGAATASADASANVREIASAADELATSVAEIDRQVAQSNNIAIKGVNEAERTNATVKELNEAAGRIGDVVRLITDIAEQTNLLALNATIEAARAGDAGRGFAVVASEVKALAGQTAKATEDISAQITSMQHATIRSIEAIGAIERTIREMGDISGAIAAAIQSRVPPPMRSRAASRPRPTAQSRQPTRWRGWARPRRRRATTRAR